ncbi:hypothetical protein [Bifidobacterium pseudocatenulatum]|uniref:hypothetical protein n=1 Tax=Bifidobacterium pseudocatenulatum TaxID=28026 RepID=UPI0034A13C70
MARRGYVQLVNGFYDNDKIRDLVRMGRADSVGVYCMALSLCGDRLTDGFVPRRAMLSNIGATPEQVRALVDEGMLEEVEEGWLIHDYTAHNRTREQVLHARADAKERKSKSRCHSSVTAVSQRDMRVTSGQTPEHQNTRTQKKEKEEYSSSFSKETSADEYLEAGRPEADRQISRQYPNLDLTDAWGAFMQHHHGETRTIADWTRLWKGWCQRRANMSGIPPSKRHVHTWQCEHVLQALGRNKETATPDQRACQMAKQLNKEKS